MPGAVMKDKLSHTCPQRETSEPLNQPPGTKARVQHRVATVDEPQSPLSHRGNHSDYVCYYLCKGRRLCDSRHWPGRRQAQPTTSTSAMLLVPWRVSHHPPTPQIHRVTWSTLGAWKLDSLNQCLPLCHSWLLAAGLWDAAVCRHKQCWWLSPSYLLWGSTAWFQPSEELRWSQEPPPVICLVSPWCLNVNKRLCE